MLCRYCTAGKCKNLSTADDRAEIECPSCNGFGCDECKDGCFEIDGCPNAFCKGTVNAIDLFDLFEKGLPPVSGGVLDQSVSFIAAAQFFDSEERRIRNERISRNPYQS